MAALDVNHPYMAVVEGPEIMQFILVVERIPVCKTESFLEALWNMVSLYFVFDIVYPKSLNALLIFVQHFVLSIVDKQAVPNAATRVYSALNSIV